MTAGCWSRGPSLLTRPGDRRFCPQRCRVGIGVAQGFVWSEPPDHGNRAAGAHSRLCPAAASEPAEPVGGERGERSPGRAPRGLLLASSRIQQLFKYKHFSDGFTSLINFQTAEVVIFVSFVHLFHCFMGRGFTGLTGPQLEALPAYF